MKLHEVKYDHDRFPDGLKRTMLNRMLNDIAKQLKLKQTWVTFIGPGEGTRLPGYVEIVMPEVHLKEGDLEFEVLVDVLHHIVKKAFKEHLNLDVTTEPAKTLEMNTGSKSSAVMITCRVEP